MISDDDVLAAVCECSGASATADSIRRALGALLKADLDPDYVDERLERLHRAGLLRVFQLRAPDDPQFHLTEAGVERLQLLDRQPVKPATD